MHADAAAELRDYGLIPVLIYGATDGVCTCRKGSACKSPGKHPIGDSWGDRSAAYDDETLAADFDRQPDNNVGCLLGPFKGHPTPIIDIEDDSEEGGKLAAELFGDVETPRFRSGKSVHTLFRWDDRIPDGSAASGAIVVRGLEFRVGRRGKQFQSVFPPSTHASGSQYAWLPGESLADVPIARLPDSVLEFLLAGEKRTSSRTDGLSRRQAYLQRGAVTAGERNSSMSSILDGEWRRYYQASGFEVFDDATVLRDISRYVSAINRADFEPPLDWSEIEPIIERSRRYIQEQAEADVDKQGGSRNGDGTSGWLHDRGIILEANQYRSDGGWYLELLTGTDPPLCRLKSAGLSDPVTLLLSDLGDPVKVSDAVFAASHGQVILSNNPGLPWRHIWLRYKGRMGLLEDLKTNATKVTAAEPELDARTQILTRIWRLIERMVTNSSFLTTRLGSMSVGGVWSENGEVFIRFDSLIDAFAEARYRVSNNALADALKSIGAKRRRTVRNFSRERGWVLNKDAVLTLGDAIDTDLTEFYEPET